MCADVDYRIWELKKKVYEANMLLPKYSLVTLTWGNVSGIDRESGLMVIKPSGVPYDKLTPANMCVVDIADGSVKDEGFRPSSDTLTHVELYRAYSDIGGVVHTHSAYATAWAQACRGIPCYGTTHADHFYGEIPCIRPLTQEELDEGYEMNTGRVIISEFERLGIDPAAVPGCLCSCHGPFCWGKDPEDAVNCAVITEECAKMAFMTEVINNKAEVIPQRIMDKHYYRKHGEGAYYGQN